MGTAAQDIRGGESGAEFGLRHNSWRRAQDAQRVRLICARHPCAAILSCSNAPSAGLSIRWSLTCKNEEIDEASGPQ
eukprot:scaffold281282_cov36-Tisochrysis_lutea.AAC.5